MNATTQIISEDIKMAQQSDHGHTEGISMSEEEYLATEPNSEVRREYIDGHAYAMSGASSNHNLLAGNLFGEFRQHLKGKQCTAFMSDMKVLYTVAKGNNYVYPDVVVDCDKTSENRYSAESPILIVEVLSASTRKLDQTTKLLRYINLPSLLEYVMVEQDIVLINVLRKSNNWRTEYYNLGDTVTFESIGLTLSVAEIYERVNNSDMNQYVEQYRKALCDISTEVGIAPLSKSDFVDGIIKG